MEIRYITKDDNPLEISKMYESKENNHGQENFMKKTDLSVQKYS